MATVQLMKLSPKHEAILNWLLENPEKSRRECAGTFGVTETWLSIVINSNCFQARLHERQESIFNVVASDIPTKLRGVAALAIERVGELLPVAPADFALDAMDKALKNLGYSGTKDRLPVPPNGGVHVGGNAIFVASRQELEDARGLMLAVGNGAPQGALIDASREDT